MQFKTRSVNPISVFVLLISTTLGGMLGPVASAQVPSNQVLVKVPFAFNVGTSQLPAGTYSIERASASVVRILNKATSKGVLSMVNGGETRLKTPPPQVVFHRYGD